MSSMDDHLTPDSSSLSQYSAFCPDFNGQDDSVSRSQAEYSLGNIQMEGSSNTPGSSLHPPDPYVPYQGKPLCLLVGPVLVLTSSARVILVHPASRPEHSQQSVAVVFSTSVSLRRYALIIYFPTGCASMIEKSPHVPSIPVCACFYRPPTCQSPSPRPALS